MQTAVEWTEKLGAVLVQLPQTPANHVAFEPNNFGGLGGRSGSPSELVPAVRSQLIGLLRPAMPTVFDALHKTIPNEKHLHVLGVGTDRGTLAVLIGLLRAQGFQVEINFCDGSVRQGFAGPTAVLRGNSNGLL